MRIAVCDDERNAVDYIIDLLQKVEDADIRGYDDVNVLMDDIEKKLIFDLVFLDINFNKENHDGIDFAADICSVCPSTQIVFVTGYETQYSQDIFKEGINLCGFLVKPVSQKRLDVLVDKARKNMHEYNVDNVFVNVNKSIKMIPMKTIVYIESQGHKLIIHTVSEPVDVYKKLDELLPELSSDFVRSHKSYVLNMAYIRRIEGTAIELTNGKKLPISRANRAQVLNTFSEFIKKRV